jgi:hypothetical protein
MTTNRLAASVSGTFASLRAIPCTKETTRCTSTRAASQRQVELWSCAYPISVDYEATSTSAPTRKQ